MPSSASALVHIFGDSILADNTPIQADLQRFAPHANIANFAQIGAGMRDGWVESIPSVYAKHRSPVPCTIILDGGGNDVNAVRQECMAFSGKCKETIDSVVDLVAGLVEEMRDDGVHDIVYAGFYYLKGFEAAVDYANEKVLGVCHESEKCHFVDLRRIKVDVGWDSLHPVEESYHDIAKEILKTLVKQNVTMA